MNKKIRKIPQNTSEDGKFENESSVGERLEVTDPMDVEIRIIDLGQKSDIKHEMSHAIDNAEMTSQYIKLTNRNLKKRLEKVKELKFEDSFSPLIDTKSGDNSKSIAQLRSIPTNDLSIHEIKKLLEHRYSIYDDIKSNFDAAKKKLVYFLNELKIQEESIKKLVDVFEKKQLQENEQKPKTKVYVDKSEAITKIQNELSKCEKYDSESLSDAIKTLRSKLNLESV